GPAVADGHGALQRAAVDDVGVRAVAAVGGHRAGGAGDGDRVVAGAAEDQQVAAVGVEDGVVARPGVEDHGVVGRVGGVGVAAGDRDRLVVVARRPGRLPLDGAGGFEEGVGG